jgi:hypothetical protein
MNRLVWVCVVITGFGCRSEPAPPEINIAPDPPALGAVADLPVCGCDHEHGLARPAKVVGLAGDKTIKVYINLSLPNVTKDFLHKAVIEGLCEWERVGKVDFVEVSDPGRADLQMLVAATLEYQAWGIYYPGGNKVFINRWRWMNDPYIGDDKGSMAAKYRLVKYTMAHEAGHWMGFGHQGDTSNIMNMTNAVMILNGAGPTDLQQMRYRYGLRGVPLAACAKTDGSTPAPPTVAWTKVPPGFKAAVPALKPREFTSTGAVNLFNKDGKVFPFRLLPLKEFPRDKFVRSSGVLNIDGTEAVVATVPDKDQRKIYTVGKAKYSFERTIAPRFRLPFGQGFNYPTQDGITYWWTRVGKTALKNQKITPPPGSTYVATPLMSEVADVSVAADVDTLRGGGKAMWPGLIARYQGPGETNMYLAAFGSDGNRNWLALWKNVDGKWSPVIKGTTVPESKGRLRFDVYGRELRVYLDGKAKLIAKDESLTHGIVGIRGMGGTMDNFRATRIFPDTRY